MNRSILLIATAFVAIGLAGCSPESDNTDAVQTPDAATSASQPPATATPATSAAATTASATGVITAVDPAAGTITIEHGPVAALQWPAMTMSFKAGAADISTLTPGDRVAFDFTSTGMDGTLEEISKQP